MAFIRKARWVKDGHGTTDPIGSNYAGEVSRDSVRIAFTIAALNGLDICAADIQNAYIQAPTPEITMKFIVLSFVSIKGRRL